MTLQPDRHAGETFDCVIVGSGAAGSVLSARLTEESGITVCALECGPPDRHPYDLRCVAARAGALWPCPGAQRT